MTEKPWIALTGAAGAGKDTVGQLLVEHYDYERVAFGDAVREAVLDLDPFVPVDSYRHVRVSALVESYGWERAKRMFPEVRRLLQAFGTDAIRTLDPEFWVDVAQDKALALPRAVVFTDCRFQNEADMVVDQGGIVVLVERDTDLDANAIGHATEQGYRTIQPDWIISNIGTLDDLRDAIDTIMEDI